MIDKCDDITMENLKKITDFSEFVCFCGQISDPIYHANFLSLLEHVSKIKDKKFSINTNGTRKKIEWWKRAFELTKDNVKWVFGLDGTDQETANIHRVNTRFDEVMEVMKLGASMGCYIEWQFIVFRHNEHQLELAKSMAKEIGVDLNVRISGRWLDSYVEKHKIYPPSDKWTSMNGISKKIIFTYRNKNVL
jgi:MoaA/NifB/PqqE/SkfB family radical SAM enzyme